MKLPQRSGKTSWKIYLSRHIKNDKSLLFTDRTGSTLADKLEQDRLNIVNRSSCTSYFAAVAPHTLCAGDFSFGGVTACSVSLRMLFSLFFG